MEAFAATFEKECREGTTSDSRLKIAEYCDYVIDLKEQRETKHSTIVRYKDLAARIAPIIGHIKLKDLRADHLNSLYTALAQPGQNKRTGGGLSAKTILEHHRLISTVLDQAEKEGLVPFNVASKAMLPKQVEAIRDALEQEPIKWRTITHLFLITGAQRGEILGLKWDRVDFEGNRIHICNNVLYSADRGIYESTPKTDASNRFITLPLETMKLLRKYRAWQNEERLRLGEYCQPQGFVFSQDNGRPMHPDSVTDWLKKFSKRHNLPHINPHAFRHTMASMLYFNGVDSVSISKRLDHAQVSTTANIYAHVMEEADQRNADILADVFLKKA
ncbi:MAG: site-specific integrase [Oscillospiraceae bacterium]|nr:site-specific integrase [Oscillospiraceae bacterium]